MSFARFTFHTAGPAAQRPVGSRAVVSLRLVWLLALLIVVQSLMVQAHGIAHLPQPWPAPLPAAQGQLAAQEGHDNAPRAATSLTHRSPGDDDDPAQCPLCREEALSGHYLAPAPFEFAPPPPDHFAPEPVLRPAGTAHTVPTHLRIRGPPVPAQV